MAMTINEALRETYANVMRVVSTEAATTAQSSEACFKDFQLIEIPTVMVGMNASVGAKLMTRWFNSPTFVMPSSWRSGRTDFRAVSRKHIDTGILKMSWLTGFARARQALSHLKLQRTQTPAAERELKRVLMRSGLLTSSRRAIGGANDVVILHETAHLNMIGIGFGTVSTLLIAHLAALPCIWRQAVSCSRWQSVLTAIHIKPKFMRSIFMSVTTMTSRRMTSRWDIGGAKVLL